MKLKGLVPRNAVAALATNRRRAMRGLRRASPRARVEVDARVRQLRAVAADYRWIGEGLRGECLLEPRARRQTLPVRADVGMFGTDYAEGASRHQEVPHHDVGAGELVADEILLAGEPGL